MPTNFSSIGFDMAVRSSPEQPRRLEAGERFTLVVLGDFTGRTSRGVVEPLQPSRLRIVDGDNLARVFAQWGAQLHLSGAAFPGGTLDLAFGSLDDWHPDQLLAQVPWLAQLVKTRRLLLNPATADQGRAVLEACLGSTAVEATPVSEPSATPESGEDAFARLMGGVLPAKKAAAPASPLNELIKQAIAPHVSATPAAWLSGALAAVEMELHSRLRAILHHPDFQALEAAWLGLDMLVRRCESPDEIRLLALDASFAELQADLAAQPQVEDSALFRLLRDRPPGLLVGNFAFGRTAEDLCALGALAEVAAGLSTAFVASASPALAGCDCFARHPDPDDWTLSLPEDAAAAWNTLRGSPQASHVALTAPRFLARQPYGKVGAPIDTLAFEELPADPAHEAFLWGHSGLLVASAVIDAIQAGDSDLAEFTGGEIGELPIHPYTEEGEKVVKSFAEAWLSDRAVERLRRAGLLPVAPVKNSDTIHLAHLGSVAATPTALHLGR